MLKLNDVYQPLTSRPFLSNEFYREYLPCEALRPFISCFWTTSNDKTAGNDNEILVIPDTCMDVIIRVNHTDQTIAGYLCGIQDRPFRTIEQSVKSVSCFAVRFHFWAAHLFLNLNFMEARNQMIDLPALGSEWNMLFEPFLYFREMNERITWVESFLLKKLADIYCNPVLFGAIHRILSVSGGESIKNLCEYSCVSQRQLERLFLKEIGLPPKRVANLVRYQNVWRDMLMTSHFNIQDAVFRYGYTDQSHLLNEFRRYHGVWPKEAKVIAERNQ